jgi:hypothetical protein
MISAWNTNQLSAVDAQAGVTNVVGISTTTNTTNPFQNVNPYGQNPNLYPGIGDQSSLSGSASVTASSPLVWLVVVALAWFYFRKGGLL